MSKKLFCIALLIATTLHVYGQASWERFGQNRVQYRTFSWKYFDSLHFRTFFYDYGKANAMYANNIAEQELEHIVYMMGGRLNKKLNIILYNSFGDFRQTNLGRKNEDLNVANGGKVDVAGDYIAIYFDGDHNNLKRQIRSGIAKVIKDNMLFGSNLKDVVKNAVQMNLPEWYTLGYVAFIADEWTGEKNADVQNMLNPKGKKNYFDIAQNDPTLVGHSFWHFVSTKYGENYISNLLYLTRYRKTVNNAIENVFKKSPKLLFTEWENFYENIQQNDALTDSLSERTLLTTINTKSGAHYSQIAVSPTGAEIAYVEKKDGRFNVYIQNVKYNKSKVLIEGGIRGLAELADPDYPMLCWSPSGNKMAVLYQQKNRLNLRVFTSGKNIMEKRTIPRNKFDRVTGACFMEDENTLAITAVKKGQSDLYTLTIKNNRLTPITNDLFDDKEPHLIQSGTVVGILFLSNRTTKFSSDLKTSDNFNPHFNAFLYQQKNGSSILTPLSKVNGNIKNAMQWGLDQYTYLEDERGNLSRKIVDIEKLDIGDTFSIKKSAPTSFDILSQEYLHTKEKIVEITRQNENYLIYSTPLSILKARDEKFDTMQVAMLNDTILNAEAKLANTASEYITPFESETDSTVFLDNIFNKVPKSESRYQSFVAASTVAKPKIYKTSFYPDFIQTSLDNTLLFTRYQPLSSTFNNVDLSGFLTSTLTDVMEDYKLTGGARLGVDFRSLDYFLQFANFRRRADWGFLYFHTNRRREGLAPAPYISPYSVLGKEQMDYFQGNLNYPLSMLTSIRFQLGLRYDRTRYLAREQYSIAIPNSNQYWSVGKLEFVYDNTINPMLNIWKGSRAKIFVEFQQQLSKPGSSLTNVGYDFRNYLTIYKNFILASRFAGAHSWGNAKILYYLGGVDNPIRAQFDGNTVVNTNSGFAFQTLATNLRGYKQGARNGSSYMVVNEEFRLPLYNTFFKRPIKSGFIRNLQLVAFADFGLTINGVLPSVKNVTNTIRIQVDNNIAVFFERSLALGYGGGLRTRLLGYFIRADVAWNVEGRPKPMLHVSLATDF